MELPHSLYSVIFETPFCKADKNAYPYNIAMSFNLDLESAKEAIWIQGQWSIFVREETGDE